MPPGRVLGMMLRHALLLAAILALTACGLGTPIDSGDAMPRPSHGAQRALTIVDASVDRPAVPVDAAPDVASDPIRVSGALFVDVDGSVRLCGAIAESFPPQCGGERLTVIGLDLASVELEEANGVRWAEGVELVGTIS